MMNREEEDLNSSRITSLDINTTNINSCMDFKEVGSLEGFPEGFQEGFSSDKDQEGDLKSDEMFLKIKNGDREDQKGFIKM